MVFHGITLYVISTNFLEGYVKMTNLTSEEIQMRMEGNWEAALQDLCAGAFDPAYKKVGGKTDCPLNIAGHGGKNDFRFFANREKTRIPEPEKHAIAICTCGSYNGYKLLAAYHKCSSAEVMAMLGTYLGSNSSILPIPPKAPVAARDLECREDNEKIQRVLANYWQGSSPLTVTSPALSYYRNRGIPETSPLWKELVNGSSIRWMRSLRYFENGGFLDSFPVLVAAFHNVDNTLVSLHRTFLNNEEGSVPACQYKAKVSSPKKMLAREFSFELKGSVCRVFSSYLPQEDGSKAISPVLGLTEGIENALAVRQLAIQGKFGSELETIPVWASGNAVLMRQFQVPVFMKNALKKLIIFADNDENETGQKAAQALKDRLAADPETAHIQVSIRLPLVIGTDWNDELINEGGC